MSEQRRPPAPVAKSNLLQRAPDLPVAIANPLFVVCDDAFRMLGIGDAAKRVAASTRT